MVKTLIVNDKEIKYHLQYKNVKNINLRIKPDGSVNVSANKFVSQKSIDAFIMAKSDLILKALDKFKNKAEASTIQYFSEDEICDVIEDICEKMYPYWKEKNIPCPALKFKKMVSQWGSCRPQKGILTFNTNLMYAPLECIEYVVCHEFTHFIHANHSKKFYDELEIICPKWKESRRKLKGIYLHK